MPSPSEQTAKVLRAWEKSAPRYDKQIAFFERIQFRGGREWLGARARGKVLGRLLLLDHIGSSWPPVYAWHWLAERLTIRAAGEYFTRRQLPLVRAAGFEILESERLKAGTVERVHARKPVAA